MGLSVLLGERCVFHHIHLAPTWIQSRSGGIYELYVIGLFENISEGPLTLHSPLDMFRRVKEVKARGGALPIMFTIWGGTDIPETELTHLDGYRGSKPVRVGNGAASHIQLDIYGELMDGIYLSNR